jgi:hypothetical protein
MGGPGSGNRLWRRTRPDLVEDAFALDLSALIRARRIVPGTVAVGQWEVRMPARNHCMNIRYNADLADLAAASLVLEFSSTRTERRQRINLAVTEPHLGGIRLWFLCPITGQRARVLYLPDGQREFASREAHKLSYRSQGESHLLRSINQAQNVRARLGGELSIHSLFPSRPRGMHRRTYERLREEGLEIEKLALQRLHRKGWA